MSEVIPEVELSTKIKNRKLNTKQEVENEYDKDLKYQQSSFLYFFHIYLTIFLKFLSVIICLVILFLSPTLLSFIIQIDPDSNEKPNEFKFFLASEFAHIHYYGKQRLFRTIIKDMKRVIETTTGGSDAELSRDFDVIERNWLFNGPPGTGKTLFVKKIIYLLDRAFAKQYNDESKTYVRAYFITPSMLEDKYKGETERKIRTLFDEARRNKEFKCSILFIDEIDAFFGKRSTETQDINVKPMSEFLSLLSGISEDVRSNCFLVGATNLVSNIDSAFLRRMGHVIEFLNPTKNEIVNLLKEISVDWKVEENVENKINEIATLLHARAASQSLIATICKKLISTYTRKQDNLFQLLLEATQRAEQHCRAKDNEILADLMMRIRRQGVQIPLQNLPEPEKCQFEATFFEFEINDREDSNENK